VVFLFRDKSVVNVFFLLVLSLAVHLHFFVASPVVYATENDGFIGLFLLKYIRPLPTPFLVLLYHFLVLVQAMRLNATLNTYRMFQHSGHTTAMAYVLLSGFFTQWCAITPALVANSLVIWIFILLCKMYNHPSPKAHLFNTGLVAGLTILCYHPTSILVLITLFALAVVRPFRITEWFILIMGICMPFYFLISFLYLTDQVSYITRYLSSIHFHLPLEKADMWLWITLGILGVILFSGLYYWQLNNTRLVIQIRKNWGVMMVLLLLMLPIPFLFKGVGIEAAVLSLIPIAAYSSNAFLYPRRLLFPNLLFWLAVVAIVHNNWQLIKN